MAGKDISDMSFDEFFLGKKAPSKTSEQRPRPAEDQPDGPVASSDVDSSGFSRGRPKFNIRSGRVLLYIPKYEGGKGARYDLSVEQDGRSVILGRLKSSPLDSDVSSIPTEFDLTDVEISPLGELTIVIDGKKVYEIFAHSHMMFSADGMPISRAEDTTVVLYPEGKHLWLMDAKVASSAELDGMRLDTVEVAKGGYIRVRDRPQPVEKVAEPERKVPVKKTKPKAAASLIMPAPESVAGIRDGGRVAPLYGAAPDFRIEAVNVDPEVCTVRTETSDGKAEVPLAQFDVSSLDGVDGRVAVSVVFEGKVLATETYYVATGFSCDYSAKGDIPEYEIVTFTIGTEEYHRNIYEDGLDGPYPLGGSDVMLAWNIPVVTYDVGAGPVSFREGDVSVDDLPDSIVVTVRGAYKKAVFLGGSGKKVNLTQEWEDDTVRIDTTPIATAVFDSPTRDAALYITVNSCPVRRFLTVTNQAGISYEYSHGELKVMVGGSGSHECRVFNLDKTVEVHVLEEGENRIAVSKLAIAADILEMRGGKEISVESVTIREIPFLLRDDMGDVWFYVSKDKRIPLPDGLLESGAKNPAEIRKWHSQIVRMNPELKNVSPEKTVKAFNAFNPS